MIHPNRPSIVRRDMDSVLTCLISDNLGGGQPSRELLNSVSETLGYCGGVGLADGQRCMEVALAASGVVRGDTIALSPLAPAWYHWLLDERGLIPRYWDLDPKSGIPVHDGHLHEDVKLAICRHHLGQVGSIEYWTERSIPVIEDISESLGSILFASPRYTGDRPMDEETGGANTKSGTLANYAVLDMGENTLFMSGGGGLLLVANKRRLGEIKQNLKRMCETLALPGLQAALGLSQWNRLGKLIARREEILKVYQGALERSHYRPLTPVDGRKSMPMALTILITTGWGEVSAYAKKNGVPCRRAFRDSILASHIEDGVDLPGARQLLLKCVNFPLYPSLSNDEVQHISKVLASLP